MSTRQMKMIIFLVITTFLIFPQSSWSGITVKKTLDGEIEFVDTHTQGIGMTFKDIQTSFKVQVDFHKQVRAENLRFQEREQRRRERAEKRGKEYVPEKRKPDYYKLSFTYSSSDSLAGHSPFARKFIAGGVKIELFLDGKPIELDKLNQHGGGTIAFVWVEEFRVTEKELNEIANASKIDFEISNTRGQSIEWYIPEKDVNELREFCTKFADIKTEEKPLSKRSETAKIVGFSYKGKIIGQPGEASLTREELSKEETTRETQKEEDIGKEIKKGLDKGLKDIRKRLPF